MEKRTTETLVRGMQTDGYKIRVRDIMVRITKDKLGMTLSLSNEDDVMLAIPLEPVKERLREVLK
jgi:hypothetical protein